jgi:pyruvate kinase
MLSGETAIGEFPIEAASAATAIAREAESRGEAYRAPDPPCRHRGEAGAVAHAAASIVQGHGEIAAIACYTETGRTARLLSAERPGSPIYAFVPDEAVRRSMALLWGVVPLPARMPEDTDDMIAMMDEGLRGADLVEVGASVVMAASSPAGRTTTNLLKVHEIGSPVR